ncbi:ketopantoate reductase family protein [Bhargavaea ullalensis]|uniref:2-dehydropantoate 2-reductase n=1 Tax=Bhargavaea ullalensis TaxID=1265685 RepID=A0ABV2GC49_9BACL
MKLNIAGAGAIGLLLGAGFADAGFDVRMLTRSPEQAALLRQEGITVERSGEKKVFQVEATAAPGEWSNAELTILAMKSYDLAGFLETAGGRLASSPLLFVQNGVAHLTMAESLPNPSSAFASVEHGAMKTGQTAVRHTGTGPLRIAPGKGDGAILRELALADTASFPVRLEEDAFRLLFSKALKNAIINPVTAIFGVRNGEIAESAELGRLAGMLHAELSGAFPDVADGVSLESVFDLCRRTAGNESSMLADIKSGRRTESDAILGGLIEEAARRGCRLPLLSGIAEMTAFLERRESDG